MAISTKLKAKVFEDFLLSQKEKLFYVVNPQIEVFVKYENILMPKRMGL